MIDNFRKLTNLSKREKILLVKATFLLPVIRFSLFSIGYDRTIKIIERISDSSKQRRNLSITGIDREIKFFSEIVTIASRYGFYRSSCLQNAILVWWWLREEKIDTIIRFGVRLEHRHFQAHAWIEYAGSPVFGGEASPRNFHVLVADLPQNEEA